MAIGDNGAMKPEQIEAVLGSETVQQLAQKLGIDTGKAAATLAQLLPQGRGSAHPQRLDRGRSA